MYGVKIYPLYPIQFHQNPYLYTQHMSLKNSYHSLVTVLFLLFFFLFYISNLLPKPHHKSGNQNITQFFLPENISLCVFFILFFSKLQSPFALAIWLTTVNNWQLLQSALSLNHMYINLYFSFRTYIRMFH